MGQWEEEKKWKWANPTSKYYKDGSTPYRFKREYGSQGKGKGLFKYLSEEKPVTTMFEDIKSGFKERADKRKQAKSDAKAKRMEEFTTKYGISNLSKEQIEDWLPKMKEELTEWEKMLKESKIERFKQIHAYYAREEAKKVFWNKVAWTLMVMASIYVASLWIAALI